MAHDTLTDGIGSLEWTTRTGGAMTWREKAVFLLSAAPGFLAACARRIFRPRQARKTDLKALAPPDTPMVQEAIRLVRQHAHPAMANHAFRTAYWALVVMERELGRLEPREIEEAWVAGLLHDIGLDLTPASGEFTLGGVEAVRRLAARFGWDEGSTRRACAAITLNPNGRVDRERHGLLAWAMNVGGFGETSRGPYRVLMHPDNVRELEEMHPRAGFHAAVPSVVARELERFPNQRFAVLRAIGFVSRRLPD